MTIRAKIIGGLASMALIGLVFGVVGLISTRMLANMSDELYSLQKANTEVASVLSAHYTWRHGLTEAVFVGTEFKGALDPRMCALGKWRNSEEAQNITDPEIISLLLQVDEPHTFIHTEAKNIVELLQAENADEAKDSLMNAVLPKTQEVIGILTDMHTRYAALTEEKSADIVSLENRITRIILGLIVLAVIIAVFLSRIVSESIMRPLRTITSVAETVAEGDTDVHATYHVNDQIGRLMKSFQSLVDATKIQISAAEALANGDLTVQIEPRSEKDTMSFAFIKMLDNLNHMFGEIRSSASQASIGSKQIADGAQSLAQGSTEQTSSIEELSAAIHKVADKTMRNTDIAKEAADLSDAIRDSAEKGSAQMDRMMQAVREINEASGQINKVIKVIDDIAFQTNILALNAAVEAARAGQHGKGFSVVAEEVRNLAAKSAEAAKDTGGLIEDSIAKANFGLGIATETSASLKDIVEGINRSAEIVMQIAHSSDEQADAIARINTGIDQVAQVVRKNSETAEESASASEELSGQSDMLERLVSQFKLKDTEPSLSFDGPRKRDFAPPRESDFSLTDAYGKY
jgi:methyl-accepting chemotaxis protein